MKTKALSFWDVPNLATPALLINRANMGLKGALNKVDLPSNLRLLWIRDASLRELEFVERLIENGSTVKEHTFQEEHVLTNLLETFKPDLILLPFSYKRHSSITVIKEFAKTQAVLAIFYSLSHHNFNLLLPLSENEILQKAYALSNFHRSQTERTPFDLIVSELAIEHQAEAYSLNRLEHKALTPFKTDIEHCFDKTGSVIIIAPHPDDAEIGVGALINKLKNRDVHTAVLNATTGHRAHITTASMKEHPALPKNLLKEISDISSDLIENNAVKAKIRCCESKSALAYLNKEVIFKNLALPFYDAPNYMKSEEDKRIIDQAFRKVVHSSLKKVTFFLPDPSDAHRCHRATTELFLEQIVAFKQMNPIYDIYVGFYHTPWTGPWNLYNYSKKRGSRLAAIVGTELLSGHGQEPLEAKSLGGHFAERFFISSLF